RRLRDGGFPLLPGDRDDDAFVTGEAVGSELADQAGRAGLPGHERGSQLLGGVVDLPPPSASSGGRLRGEPGPGGERLPAVRATVGSHDQSVSGRFSTTRDRSPPMRTVSVRNQSKF